MDTSKFMLLRVFPCIDFPSIHGLKSIGYVQLAFSHSYTKPLPSTRPRTRNSSKPTNCAATTAVAMAVVVLVVAFALPYR